MCRPVPASWRIPIPSRSSRNASTRPEPCFAPPRRPGASPARPGAGSKFTCPGPDPGPFQTRAGVTTPDQRRTTPLRFVVRRVRGKVNVSGEVGEMRDTSKWKHDGVQVIPGGSLDANTPQTPGMDRKTAIDLARAGARKLWAGTVNIKPNAKTGAHHHGELESVIYVVRGRARMRWGERLAFAAEARPGDFIYVPPFRPHQEINARPS